MRPNSGGGCLRYVSGGKSTVPLRAAARGCEHRRGGTPHPLFLLEILRRRGRRVLIRLNRRAKPLRRKAASAPGCRRDPRANPDAVAHRVAGIDDDLLGGLENLTIFPHMPGDPYTKVEEQMTRFAEEVLPKL